LCSGVFLNASAFSSLGAVGPQALEALLGALLVEAREWYRLTAGVDAVHQRLLGCKLGLAAEGEQRLDARPSTGCSNLTHLRFVGHLVGAVIAALVEPVAIVVEALTVALVIVHDVEVVRVDLKAPDGHGVVDADVPRSVPSRHGRMFVRITLPNDKTIEFETSLANLIGD